MFECARVHVCNFNYSVCMFPRFSAVLLCVCECVCACVHVCARTCVRVCVRACVCVCVCMCVCTCACMHACACLHNTPACPYVDRLCTAACKVHVVRSYFCLLFTVESPPPSTVGHKEAGATCLPSMSSSPAAGS